MTDRNDLDDQLFGTFSMCRDLIRQTPIQAENREDLQKALNRASGGVIFTTSPTPHSSGLPERRLRRTTPTRPSCSASTSTFERLGFWRAPKEVAGLVMEATGIRKARNIA